MSNCLHIRLRRFAGAPGFIKRWNLRRRQRDGYTTGDGITPENLPGVEAIFYRTLEQLQAIFQRAPAVLEWVARLWNSRLADCHGDWVGGIPGDLGPLLDEIGTHYLPYLCANVEAVAAGKKRFDADIGGVAYRGARYSRYRVWCLKELRSRFEALPDAVRGRARQLLERHGCWEPLWRQAELPLLAGQEQGLPFRATTKMVGVNEEM